MQNSVKWKHNRELIWKKCVHASGRQFFKKSQGYSDAESAEHFGSRSGFNAYWQPVREIIRASLTEFS